MGKIEAALQWQLDIAADDGHGYDQIHRWGENGDYDCSSMNIQAWENAGVPVKSAGATYTGNIRNIYLAQGFADVTSSVNLHTGAGLQPGDVCLNHAHHVATYVGNGQLVHASINELGRAVGGRPGDQTGREICVRSYYNYPWDCVLRYVGDNNGGIIVNPVVPDAHMENVKIGQQESINFTGVDIDVDGKYGPETKRNKIRVLQVALNRDYCGPNALVRRCYDTPLVIDGEYGTKTDAAVDHHYIELGECQFMVTAMEICAYMGGNDPHGVEYPGIFGQGLKAVLNNEYINADYFRWVFAVV